MALSILEQLVLLSDLKIVSSWNLGRYGGIHLWNDFFFPYKAGEYWWTLRINLWEVLNQLEPGAGAYLVQEPVQGWVNFAAF